MESAKETHELQKNTLTGFVEEIVFRNDENGFTVMVVDCEGVYWHAKGVMPYVREGEQVLLTGRFVEHPTYGMQFEVKQCETSLPASEGDLLRYLGSGMIRGVGPAMAAKLIEAFGEETFDVLSYNPDRLLAIPGIGRKKLEEIVSSYREQFESRDVIMQLQKLGLSSQMSLKVYQRLGPDAVGLIHNNPYQLAELVSGFGFRHADALARRMGLDPGSPERIRGGLHYVLVESTSQGHTFVHSAGLGAQVAELLGIPGETVSQVLSEMVLRGEIYLEVPSEAEEAGENAVYLPALYLAESRVARFLAEMAGTPVGKVTVQLDEEIDKIEARLGIAFSELQRQAVKAGVNEKIAVITGGPGTGKTTIINGLIRIFESAGLSIALAAPTGRAAKRMTEATRREAKTIHRLLEYTFSEDREFLSFQKNEDAPLEAEVLILDEVSMIDIVLMQHLSKAIKPETRLILVGDADQLPSVGPGNVLRDIIDSKCVPVIRLTEIFRQSERSMIALNAHRINHGEYPVLNDRDKDFFLVTARQQDDIAALIVDLVKRRLPEYYGVDAIKDIQILTPVKNSKVGTKALNELLQHALNGEVEKPHKKIGDRVFKVGDKVMQIKNNYSMKWVTDDAMEGDGVFNGDMGYIESILEAERKMAIRFDDDKLAHYEFNQLEEVTHAYAVTVHKSQGSEYPIVIMPVTWFPPMLMSRNILYTAVTRAKKIVVLVGDEKYMKMMVDRTDVNQRNTALSRKIAEQIAFIEEMGENR
ncbi:SF1B family DNA helicase RecD2 [Acidaminobacter hydrogenoformans]|uniref:ATP-dependent RecD2 DNA helicase n=1 Tax=Acidaminobacter hydrogenoformans DSM 2784 TaxID=1120920 RepID=A0A1G5S355_9FIRM|nr:ATP-dependent RecD-like DNA helicase [Acidaminobacter hydrogenoformans]SCZ80557.1 ATP-dependent DNA helicase, RecD/TraA family [Acidaminobacter hydrogenoformans DSM 2784]